VGEPMVPPRAPSFCATHSAGRAKPPGRLSQPPARTWHRVGGNDVSPHQPPFLFVQRTQRSAPASRPAEPASCSDVAQGGGKRCFPPPTPLPFRATHAALRASLPAG